MPKSGSTTSASRAPRGLIGSFIGVFTGRRGPVPEATLPVHDAELVGPDLHRRALLPVRPGDGDRCGRGLAEAEVDPAQLPAGVATANRDLPALDAVSGGDLHPGADSVAVRAVLPQ